MSRVIDDGVLASVGCLWRAFPDRSRGWLLLPVPSLIVWVSTIAMVADRLGQR